MKCVFCGADISGFAMVYPPSREHACLRCFKELPEADDCLSYWQTVQLEAEA